MFIKDCHRINLEAPLTIDDVQYPAGYFRDAGARAAHGITEVPDPVRPDERFNWITENDDGTLNVTPKPLDPIKDELCRQVDAAADAVYAAIGGNRVAEYQKTEIEAEAFKATGYVEPAPRTIQSYMDASGLSAQAATDNILQSADLYNDALYNVRDARLQGKAAIRAAAAGQAAQDAANDIYVALQVIAKAFV